MLSVLVINTKGGCGKTTIATGLASAFANAGLRTLLADCDRQRSSLGWASRRPKRVAPVEAVDWSKSISPPPDDYDRLVIDAPAALRRTQFAELVRVSDIVVMPVAPSVYDEAESERFLARLEKLKPIRKGRRSLGVVGNRVRARTIAAEHLEAFHARLGHRPIARLRDSQIYATTALHGLTPFDLASQRARNFVEDWHPLLDFVGQPAAAPPQR